MAEITLYQYAADLGVESASPFCVKVHRALVFKGLDYQVQVVGNPNEMKRLNPGVLKVPVLGWDDELVRDSTRILHFLDEKVPEPLLFPAEPQANARTRLMEDWADEAFYWFPVYMRWQVDSNYQPFAERAFGSMPIPLRWFLPKFIRRQVKGQLWGQGTGRLTIDRVLSMLEDHLQMLENLLGKNNFLGGEHPDAADIAIFGPLRAVAVDCIPESAKVIHQFPSIVNWLDRIDNATTGDHTVPFP
ncbi:MAG: glutathione S-transferase family protein [Proteobacteria bacterium]|jgi:glutathione S-transferase|nr:glutathione S-transferase family protein [Pseudomonadota bacterium]